MFSKIIRREQNEKIGILSIITNNFEYKELQKNLKINDVVTYANTYY